MPNSYYYQQISKNQKNERLLNALESYSDEHRKQIYVVASPLGDARYNYDYDDGLAILAPDHQIIFVQLDGDKSEFDLYVDDFIEDLASISDKFRYKDKIGRPRHWKSLTTSRRSDSIDNVETLLAETALPSGKEKRISELLISLVTGSINDISGIDTEEPTSLLEKIKQKIILFDGDQTRFIYKKPDKKKITIQGLSGTGKTELLLHKLKEIYVEESSARIAFTCHNEILADSLRGRIPGFFNFMRVEEQIAWNKKLWCMRAWGASGNPNTGTYSYLCSWYGLQFHPYSPFNSFENICAKALQELRSLENFKPAFDYMLVDESQDLPDSFFELCNFVTRTTVYVAGDIFQSIFDDDIVTEIEPDFLLSKCYRTDPRTLMFAHALGMALFEKPKMRWLDDDEWRACGYNLEKTADEYMLTREPLRRFEDIDATEFSSIDLVKTSKALEETAEVKIIEIIKEIITEHPTVTPDDIGIIFIENSKNTYASADKLSYSIPKNFGWHTNKAYESKSSRPGELLISNRNNVKGLEFPFVICVTKKIQRSQRYRNALYMMLSRSFLKTYLLTSHDTNEALLREIEPGLREIKDNFVLRVIPPDENEKEQIRTAFKQTEPNKSFYDFVNEIFDEIDVLPIFRPRLLNIVLETIGEDFDAAKVRKVAKFNYELMQPDDL